MPSYCFESCVQEQAIAEPIEGDGDMTFYWVRTKLGTIDRWSERDYWSDVEFVRPVEMTGTADTDVMQDDLAKILVALGLGDHARPKSPHEVVMTEILPAITELVEAPQ